MALIERLKTREDRDRLLPRGLLDIYRLKTPLESRVLLDIFPVFVGGRRADQLYLPSGQGGLQNVGGVQRALRAAGADDRVELIDKEENVAVLRSLVHDIFDALLKLAPVLGARDHAGKIQHKDASSPDIFRDEAHGNTLRQPLHDGGLADARLTDQTGVVLITTAQDLYDPGDLLLPPDDRVKPALRGEGCEISAVGIQGRRRPCGAPHGASAEEVLLVEHAFHAHRDDRVPIHTADIDPHRVQKTGRHAVRVTKQCEQDVLRADQLRAERGGQRLALAHHALRPGCKTAFFLDQDSVSRGDQFFDQAGQLLRRDPRI